MRVGGQEYHDDVRPHGTAPLVVIGKSEGVSEETFIAQGVVVAAGIHMAEWLVRHRRGMRNEG